MPIFTLTTPGLSINSYLIVDEDSRKAIAIDPTRDVQPILDLLAENRAELLYIVETHVHADFVSGAKELKAHLVGKPQIFCSAMGGKAWIPTYADGMLHDRESLAFGTSKLEAWHSPGHTPEHMMYVLYREGKPEAAFTGDFLFSGSVGRPDLLGSEQMQTLAKNLYHTIFSVLPELPGYLPVLPAHGAGSLCGKGIGQQRETTLEQEWKTNPSLQKQEEGEWTKTLLKGMPKAPAYFSLLKKLNVSGAPLIKDVITMKEMTFKQFKQANGFILDIRNQEDFAQTHLKGSINIPWSPIFIRWSGEFVPHNTPVFIVGEGKSQIKEAEKSLGLIGIDEIVGHVEISETMGIEMDSFPMINGSELLERRAQYEVVDVRTDAEWNQGHISGAQHHEINGIKDVLDQLPKGKKIAFVCGSGYRSSIAASLAQKQGIEEVVNVRGGMQAWNQSKLPTEKS